MTHIQKAGLALGLILLIAGAGLFTFKPKVNPFPDLNTPDLPIEGSANEAPLIRVIYPFFCPECASFQKDVIGKVFGEVQETRQARLQLIPVIPQAMEKETEARRQMAHQLAMTTLCLAKSNGSTAGIWFAKFATEPLSDGSATPERLRELGETPILDKDIPVLRRCLKNEEMSTELDGSNRVMAESGLKDGVYVLVADRLVTNRWGQRSWQFSDIQQEVQRQLKDRSRGYPPTEP